MKSHRNTASQAATVVLSALLLVPSIATSAPAPVGVKVMLQPWTPMTDDDSVKTVLDSPDAISAGLSQAYAQSKTSIIETLTKGLGKPDLITKGVTLYDININLNAPELRVEAGPNDTLKATLTMRNSSFAATATQPTAAGSYADPRCSVRFTVDVTVAIRVNDTPSRVFQSAFGPNDRILTVRDFSADAENAVCGFAKAILSIAGVWQKLTSMVNDPNLREYRKLNDALKGEVDSALATVNARIAIPAQYVRLKVWPHSAKTTVLFGVRELPVPSVRGGIVDGRVTVGDLKGLPLLIDRCDQLAFTAKVKTGPRVVLTPAGELGDAPMRSVDGVRMTGGTISGSSAVGAAQQGARLGQSCQYSMQGLVAGFPNLVSFRIANQQRPNSSSLTPNVRDVVDVVPQGWRFTDALKLLPKVDGRNVTLVAQMHGSPGYAARHDTAKPFDPSDPYRTSMAASRVTNPAVTHAVKPPTSSMASAAIAAAAAKPTNPATSPMTSSALAAAAAAKPTNPATSSLSSAAAAPIAAAKPTSPATPQWGGASLIQNTAPAAANQSVTRPSSTITSGTFKAPTSAFTAR